VTLALCATGAATSERASSSPAPSGWADELALAEATDVNPDPAVVETTLTAREADVDVGSGQKVHAWTYDGRLPGPLIRARVGDRVVVHLKNDLPAPTTLHWHGVRVSIEMDGVPDVSQPEVKPGETFTYDFIARDAGLYWYHPHVMSAAQVGFGLYGALLIEDPSDDVDIADQLTLVLSDIGFDEHGVLEPADSGGPAGMVFGREGEHILANGRIMPTLRARSGAPQRWRIVNAAKTRYFLLDLDGQPFYVIGSDGGLLEYPQKKDDLLVTPGERVDVIVTPKRPKEGALMLHANLYNRGYGSVEFRTNEDVLRVAFDDRPDAAATPLPKVSRHFDAPQIDGATKVDLLLSLPPMTATNGKPEYQINGVPSWKAKPFLTKVGERQIWTVRNDSKYAHPLHLHGFSFLPLDEKLQPLHPMAWKDTINVPIDGTVRFLVNFDERPGMWMFHCHILDHADGGMMGHVHLSSP